MNLEPHLAFTCFSGKRLHLGVTGSVSAYTSIDLMRGLQKSGAAVSVTLTEAAQEFVTKGAFAWLGADPVLTGFFESTKKPFAHLMPGQSVDGFLISPASASTIEAIAHGRADTLLACQALAYDRPIGLAAAMNTLMWQNRATQAHWRKLKRLGHRCIDPGAGLLACGAVGEGHIADLRLIYLTGLALLAPADLRGTNVLITLGPTREYWDGVRFWTNASTGLMGASFAVAAWLRGARVHVVAGPGAPWLPPDIERHDVESAAAMHAATLALHERLGSGRAPLLGICTAAVADFAPERQGDKKYKKGQPDEELCIRFTRNPDILADLGAKKRAGDFLIGFAAETDDLVANAAKKRAAKNADLIVANLVSKTQGFAAPTDAVTLVTTDGSQEWPSLGKADLAWQILDVYLALRRTDAALEKGRA